MRWTFQHPAKEKYIPCGHLSKNDICLRRMMNNAGSKPEKWFPFSQIVITLSNVFEREPL